MKNVQVNSDGLQFDNANGTHTNVNTSASADTYINLPSSSGTLALTSQAGITAHVKNAYGTLNSVNTTRTAIDATNALTLSADRIWLISGSVTMSQASGTVLNHRLILHMSPGNDWNTAAERTALLPYESSMGATRSALVVTSLGGGLTSGNVQSASGWNITTDLGVGATGARFFFDLILFTTEETTLNWYGCQVATDAGNASNFFNSTLVAVDLGVSTY